jgi:hypothetical protein
VTEPGYRPTHPHYTPVTWGPALLGRHLGHVNVGRIQFSTVADRPHWGLISVARPMPGRVWRVACSSCGCVCFGAEKVVNLRGIGKPTGYLIEMPCPEYSKPTAEG